MIRDVSNNARSLDDVMRQAYRTSYKAGRGFTSADWWGAVRQAAGRTFPGFNEKYVDGREPFPWDSILPLAGLRMATDSVRVPRLGVETRSDSTAIQIMNVAPDGAAAAAGVERGDILLALGDVTLKDQSSFDEFRTRYADQDGADLPIKVRRGSQTLTLKSTVHVVTITTGSVALDPDAGPKAIRIRHGIFSGTTGK
jgi:predicted metalloprotease with PDZ domain